MLSAVFHSSGNLIFLSKFLPKHVYFLKYYFLVKCEVACNNNDTIIMLLLLLTPRVHVLLTSPDSFFFFLFFGHACGMWKFPGQRHSSDNIESLMAMPPGNSPNIYLLLKLHKSDHAKIHLVIYLVNLSSLGDDGVLNHI